MAQIRRSGPRQGRPDIAHLPLRLPESWHRQTEWEADAAYAQGYAAGYAAAERDLADEIARAYGVKPYSAKAVIRWLIRSFDLAEREPFPTRIVGRRAA